MSHDQPRWLIVVQEHHRELFEMLRDRFRELGLVVILERRRGERRRGGSGYGVERRRAGRRQRRPIAWFYQAMPSDVFEVGERLTALPSLPPRIPMAQGPATKACPECAVVVEFEMPRFPQPPARLQVEVIHAAEVAEVRHYADVQAFTASGRPLVAQRVQARRRTSGG